MDVRVDGLGYQLQNVIVYWKGIEMLLLNLLRGHLNFLVRWFGDTAMRDHKP